MNEISTLGLDLGTSSAKAVVADTGGRVLAQASAGYAVSSAKAGYAESDPADWWNAVRACAREAVQAAVHAGGARPAAIGLSGQMHGLVLASADGEALRPALLWADSRATGALRAYRRLAPGARAGHRPAGAAAERGRPGGIRVAAGAGDAAAAALGSGIGLGEIQLTVGTGAQVLRPLAAPASRADAGVNLYRSATPDGWYQMGATLSAGLSLNWVPEAMNASWAELYASADHPGRPHDPIFVPHLSGERTPYCDPALRGSWTALSLADDRTSLLRGALEGTAFAIRDALDALLGADRPGADRLGEALSSGQGPARLRLAGGGTL